MITGEKITEKSPFIERLTHDSYVIQLRRIGKSPKNRLEKFLSIFEQSGFLGSSETIKSYIYKIDLEEIQTILNILIQIGDDPEERKRIEGEKEVWRIHEVVLRRTKRNLARKDRALEEKDKFLEENKKSLEEKDKILEENKKVFEEQTR